ncbi:MAG: hypothetical protein RMJ16_04925 [Thermoguttaceae bacterium]|nr:hypothetical protein [Thermoguttaceae bacterium]
MKRKSGYPHKELTRNHPSQTLKELVADVYECFRRQPESGHQTEPLPEFQKEASLRWTLPDTY